MLMQSAVRRGLRQGPRLRHRQAARRPRLDQRDLGGRHRRHPQLPLPGAGPRRAARRARRPLLGGRPALRARLPGAAPSWARTRWRWSRPTSRTSRRRCASSPRTSPRPSPTWSTRPWRRGRPTASSRPTRCATPCSASASPRPLASGRRTPIPDVTGELRIANREDFAEFERQLDALKRSRVAAPASVARDPARRRPRRLALGRRLRLPPGSRPPARRRRCPPRFRPAGPLRRRGARAQRRPGAGEPAADPARRRRPPRRRGGHHARPHRGQDLGRRPGTWTSTASRFRRWTVRSPCTRSGAGRSRARASAAWTWRSR